MVRKYLYYLLFLTIQPVYSRSVFPNEFPDLPLVVAAVSLNSFLEKDNGIEQKSSFIERAWLVKKNDKYVWFFSVLDLEHGFFFYEVNIDKKVMLLEGAELEYFLKKVGLK